MSIIGSKTGWKTKAAFETEEIYSMAQRKQLKFGDFENAPVERILYAPQLCYLHIFAYIAVAQWKTSISKTWRDWEPKQLAQLAVDVKLQ